MQLPNSRMEQLHSEMCSAHTERQSEQFRTRKTDNAASQKLEQVQAEIKSWADDARKIEADDRDEQSVADLVKRARKINLKLSEGYT